MAWTLLGPSGLTTAAALLAAAAVAAACAWLLAVALRWRRYYKVLAKIPTPAQGKGHVPALCDPRHQRTMLRWDGEAGPIFLVKLYWERVVIVTDPALAAILLRDPAGDKPDTYNVINKMGSAQRLPGLFSASSQSPYWRLVRKGVAPAFNPKNLRGSLPQIVSTAQSVVDVLKSLGPSSAEAGVDVDELMMRQALDVIGVVGFGIDLGAVKGFQQQQAGPGGQADSWGDLLHHLSSGMDEINRRWSDPLREILWFLPGVRQGERHIMAFRAHMERLLATVKAKGPPADSDTSITAHLLRLRDPTTGQPLSDERLLPEIATLFVAGSDTTAHTISWTLYLLSQHPQVEARLCEELKNLGLLATPAAPSPRPVRLEDLSKLPYLSACVKESMRLFPVSADGTLRVFPHDLQLGEYAVPAGTAVWMYTYGLHNSGRLWEDVNEFKPERWLEPGTEYHSAAGAAGAAAAIAAAPAEAAPAGGVGPASSGKGNSEAGGGGGPPSGLRFLPFSVGPRDCVGQALAKMNYTATLATLLGQLCFQLAPEAAGPGGVEDVVCLTLQPAKGLRMTVTPRV